MKKGNRIESGNYSRTPYWFNALNSVWRNSYGLGTKVRLDKDQLISSARSSCGLTDFGTDFWDEPLDRLLYSVNNEANLHPVGRYITKKRLENLLAVRLRAEHYFKNMPHHPALVLPADAQGHSWHMFCVCLDFESMGMTRNDILETFKARDILLGMHYPAMHLFDLYHQLGYRRGDFPVAEQIGDQTFTLPLFPAMTPDDVDRVVAVFNELLT